MDIIEVQAVRKAYGDHVVLDGIDLRVASGTIFALLGPNGAGKTTLIRILTTLAAPDGGRAAVAGFDVAREAAQVRRQITLTGQDAAVDDALTGRENLVVMGRLFGFARRDARARAARLLDETHLADAADRPVRTYSGGMRRRLDLAISVLPRPAVIFLDEPTTGLDPASRRRVWASIRALAETGTTIFLTTQYLEEADQLADRIAILDGGRIVAEGSAADLKRRVGTDLVHLAFTDEADAAAARRRLAELGAAVQDAGERRRRLGDRAASRVPTVRASADAVDSGSSGSRVPRVRAGADAADAATSTPHVLTVRTGGDAAEIRLLLDDLGELAARARLSLSSPSLDDAFLALTAATDPGADRIAGRSVADTHNDSRPEVA